MYQCQYTCVHTDLMHPHLKFLAQKLILCSGFTQSLEENRYCMHKLHSVPHLQHIRATTFSKPFASSGKGLRTQLLYLIDHPGQLVTVHSLGRFRGLLVRQRDVANGWTHAKLHHLTIRHLGHLVKVILGS